MSTPKVKPALKHGYMRLGSITRLHPRLQSLIKSLGYVGGSPLPVGTDLSRDSILPLLEVAPLHVTPINHGAYAVIGGLRQFVLARHLLADDDEVCVLIHEGRVNHESMMRRFAVEYVLLPVFAGYLDDGEVARRIGQLKEHLPEINFGSREQLAQLLDISLRSLASLHEKTDA